MFLAAIACLAVAVGLVFATATIAEAPPSNEAPGSEDGPGASLPGAADGQDTDLDVETLGLHCKAPKDESVEPAADGVSLESGWVPGEEGRDHRRCVSHFGHHTFAPDLDRTYRLHGGQGTARLVEQTGFSPADQRPQARTSLEDGASVVTEVELEVSEDGREWQTVETADHRLASVDTRGDDPVDKAVRNACFNTGTVTCPGTDSNMRQEIRFDIDAEGEAFRFVRVANPESVYTGLTGFLDFSSFELTVTPGDAASPPAEEDAERVLTCEEDILERIHSEDPCGFGGYVHEEANLDPRGVRVANTPGHWDAPSFLHTYYLGDANLESVSGEAVVRDWRGSASPVEFRTPVAWLEERDNDQLRVEVSENGTYWTEVHNFTVEPVDEGPFQDRGDVAFAGSFHVDGLDANASLLRLAPEPHPAEGEYWDSSTPWSTRHPWAYMVDSAVTVGGTLPT